MSPTNPPPPPTLPLSPSTVLKVLLVIIALLVVADIAGDAIKLNTGHDFAYGFIPKFDLDHEGNLPSAFSGMLLLCVAGVVFLIARAARAAGEPYAGHWRGLAILFVIAAFDEVAGIHELLIIPLRRITGEIAIFHFAWVIVSIPIVIVIGIVYVPFLAGIEYRFRRLVLASAAVYLFGLIGMEMIGGYVSKTRGEVNALYVAITTTEETLEMLGLSLFLYALLDYMKRRAIAVTIGATDTPRSG